MGNQIDVYAKTYVSDHVQAQLSSLFPNPPDGSTGSSGNNDSPSHHTYYSHVYTHLCPFTYLVTCSPHLSSLPVSYTLYTTCPPRVYTRSQHHVSPPSPHADAARARGVRVPLPPAPQRRGQREPVEPVAVPPHALADSGHAAQPERGGAGGGEEGGGH